MKNRVATPVSIVEDKTTDRENTCLHCCKRLVWSQTYITYMHYVDGTLYFECKKNPDASRGTADMTRIEKRHFNGTVYYRPWIGRPAGPWHPFQGFSGGWNHTDPWGRPIFG